ncbi:MAG: hypothetical protein ABIE74_07715, partial [Pseudomonadota bacterium]
KPIIEKLLSILEIEYKNDLDSMAYDLGITVEEFERMLNEKAWVQVGILKFLRRMSLFLYQDRNLLLKIYNVALETIRQFVSQADIDLVVSGIILYDRWEDESIEKCDAVEENTMKDLGRNRLGLMQWRHIIIALNTYFKTQQENPERQELSNKIRKRIREYIFRKKGWDEEITTPGEKLLFEARRIVATQYAGFMPKYFKNHNGEHIEEVPRQNRRSKLSLWIAGEGVRFGPGVSTEAFYGQVRALLEKCGGLTKDDVDALIMDAIFEEKESWDKNPKTLQAKLLYEARRIVAIRYGGFLPDTPKDHAGKQIKGIPRQTKIATLRRWIDGEEIKYGVGLASNEFYGQVRVLLEKGGGLAKDDVDALIMDAIFEEMENWDKNPKTSQARLLYEARRIVAIRFGGILPSFPKDYAGKQIKGISIQNVQTPLKRWIAGEEVKCGRGLPFEIFYGHIRAFLEKGGGLTRDHVDDLIMDAIFEEKENWDKNPKTSQARLLYEARRIVAICYGGFLPSFPKDYAGKQIKGIPRQGKRAALSRWMHGQKVTYTGTFSLQKFKRQIKTLLVKVGEMDDKRAEELINSAFTDAQ